MSGESQAFVAGYGPIIYPYPLDEERPPASATQWVRPPERRRGVFAGAFGPIPDDLPHLYRVEDTN